jgi:hypothetical protein
VIRMEASQPPGLRSQGTADKPGKQTKYPASVLKSARNLTRESGEAIPPSREVVDCIDTTLNAVYISHLRSLRIAGNGREAE